jgi:hypothetical protein
MARHGRRIKYAEAEAALRETQGLIAPAARLMGFSFQALSGYMARNPKLRELRNSYVEVLLDEAETQLAKLVHEGDLAAIKFLLSTLGKNRGYGQNADPAVTAPVNVNIAISFASPPAAVEPPALRVIDAESAEVIEFKRPEEE